MFDSVARPYVMAYSESFNKLPSCGVGGPNAQTAEAEKILSCDPDIVISEYEDVEKENALYEQLGVPVITFKGMGLMVCLMIHLRKAWNFLVRYLKEKMRQNSLHNI